MRGALFLTWKYISYYRLKTLVMITCLALTIFAPILVYVTTNTYQQKLYSRAKTVPLIIGLKGNHYDLLLRSLYFNSSYPGSINMQIYEEVKNKNFGTVIPLNLEFTAHKLFSENEVHVSYENIPIVGTYPDYFSLHKIKVRKGRFPVILGEAVVGANVAKRGNIQVGDFVLSDQKNIYDISSSYPLKMKVVGILQQEFTADDEVIFTDIRTTWIIKGIIHGHKEVKEEKQQVVIAQGTTVEYPEITADNLHLFHSHASNQDLPVTSLLILPKDHKSKTILLGDYIDSETLQIIISQDIVTQLMSTIFRIQSFLEFYFVLVAVIVTLFMFLVILLSIRIRQQEFATLSKIGSTKKMIWSILSLEIVLISLISLVISCILIATFFYFISPMRILHFFI